MSTALSRAKTGFKPRVCLVMQCKGAEPCLERNIEASLKQDYKNYFGIIVTDSTEDAAYAIADSVLARNPSANVRNSVTARQS